MYTKYLLVTAFTGLFLSWFLPLQVSGYLIAENRAVSSYSYSMLPEKKYDPYAGDSMQLSGEFEEHEQAKFKFCSILLAEPRANNDLLLSHFSYTEVPVYEFPDDSLSIILFNGYAKAPILNPGEYKVDYKRLRVSSIDIVYTKYPYEKQDWLTNYYDLLSWRLKALFEYDSLLNDSSVVWGRILQTSCKTAWEARNLFHGIVITLEPREQLAMDEDAPDDSQPRRSLPEPIENGGFLFSGERNPDYFRSRLIFEPEPGKEPRRNMDPSKLRCPTWR